MNIFSIPAYLHLTATADAGPFDVPSDTINLQLRVNIGALETQANHGEITIEFSNDGGASWDYATTYVWNWENIELKGEVNRILIGAISVPSQYLGGKVRGHAVLDTVPYTVGYEMDSINGI